MNQPTIDEIRDQIAEWDLWVKWRDAEGNVIWYMGGSLWNEEANMPVFFQHNHPIPYTLDEAAKLPEGWLWGWLCWISNPLTNCEGWWLASARHVSHDVGDNITESATTEIEARFRLRHAAMKAERGIA